ncbi:hypothetical protein WALBB_740028 [Wolbachia pipientis wAlbB]|nr:hypothetical protein WALBB_740028 [Wolbachia pipientis wAlbB]
MTEKSADEDRFLNSQNTYTVRVRKARRFVKQSLLAVVLEFSFSYNLLEFV